MAGSGYRLLGMLLIASIYVSVRFWALSDSCLWFDEIFSVHAAEHTWNGLLDFVALDLVHPPLFYISLKLWIAIGGEGLLWLRLFPAFLSVTAVVPFVLLCRQLKLAPPAGGLALLFFAVNGSLIKYSREVRMYSLLLLLSLASTWLFVRFVKTGKGVGWLAVANILLVYTHYFGWLVVLSEVVAVSIFYRERWRQVFYVTAATLVAFVPWVIAILNVVRSDANIEQNIGWMQLPGFGDAAEFILNLAEPFYYSLTNLDPRSVYIVSIPIVAAIAVGSGMYILSKKSESHAYGEAIRLLTTLIAAPLVVAFVGSWVMPLSFWGTRHLIVVFPVVFILTALMISNIEIRGVCNAIIISLCILITLGFAIDLLRPQPRFAWCGWSELASVEPGSDNALTVYTLEDLAAYSLWFSTKDRSERPMIRKLVGVKGTTEDKAYFLPRGFTEIESLPVSQLQDYQFLLYFRSPNWDEGSATINEFKALGYSVEEYASYDAGPEKAFKVRFVRK